ncbi:unnamed protein product [Pleuronectes platessa]|uniref:Uncharacterized protein n=1 Tax=Pleuronectes platessa TaxID=8262 RepID=A0A9N7YR11_PLEPL|nr:unnamed protein product [Pleuronectes platessa]
MASRAKGQRRRSTPSISFMFPAIVILSCPHLDRALIHKRSSLSSKPKGHRGPAGAIELRLKLCPARDDPASVVSYKLHPVETHMAAAAPVTSRVLEELHRANVYSELARAPGSAPKQGDWAGGQARRAVPKLSLFITATETGRGRQQVWPGQVLSEPHLKVCALKARGVAGLPKLLQERIDDSSRVIRDPRTTSKELQASLASVTKILKDNVWPSDGDLKLKRTWVMQQQAQLRVLLIAMKGFGLDGQTLTGLIALNGTG